jgi:MOSC domain-containing protein YiiM
MPNESSPVDGMTGVVVAVSRSGKHAFSKDTHPHITLRTGLGVDGDAHAGRTVQHLARIRRDPTQPNLRQVHLMHAELFSELATHGFTVRPGDLGENITTRGLPLLDLPRGTTLRIGPSAIIELTGLRNPCAQLDQFQSGLLAAVLDRDANGNVIRKAGVMAIVVRDGIVQPNDPIAIELPDGPHVPLAVV